jgi:hypothetical protein
MILGYFACSASSRVQQIGAGIGRIVDQAFVIEHVERLDGRDAGLADAAEGRHGMDHRRLRRAIGLHVDVAPGDHGAHRRLAAAQRLGRPR